MIASVSRSGSRYALGTRVLHWSAAALVFSTLLVGFFLANSLADYAVLLSVHKVLGALVFVVFVIRVVNRLTDHGPALPATVGRAERIAVIGSELAMYVLLLAQPLLGWAMVSASGVPVGLGGALRLPPIAPVDAELYGPASQQPLGCGLCPGRDDRRTRVSGAAARTDLARWHAAPDEFRER